MNRIFLIVFVLGLTGCDSLAHRDADWFEADGHPPGQFGRDDLNCVTAANDHIDYDLTGRFETRYQANRAFNAAYAACMQAHGYQPRPYYRNWLPS